MAGHLRAGLAAVALVMAWAAPVAAVTGPTVVAELDSLSATDRVHGYDLAPGGTPDVRYWAKVTAAGTHTITLVDVIDNNGDWSQWNTPNDGLWVVGVTAATEGADFLNTVLAGSDPPASDGISAPFTDSIELYLYMHDDGTFAESTFSTTVTVCLDDATSDCPTFVVGQPVDLDDDGYTAVRGGDCDDSDPDIHPGALEVPGNTVDENCDGDLGGTSVDYYLDSDSDTWGTGTATSSTTVPPGGPWATRAGDCNDSDPAVNPGAAEVAGNSVDENCAGGLNDGFVSYYVDSDGDTWGTGALQWAATAPTPSAGRDGDCNDSDPAVNPGATDLPGDGVDQDCSGADAVPTASTVAYTGASKGLWTNNKTTVSFGAAVTGDAACLANRTVSFTVNNVTKDAVTDSAGRATAQYGVAGWAYTSYPVHLTLAAAGTCLGDTGDGEWTYPAQKPRR